MSDMIRKQIYITKRQEQLLKRLSQARGVSEADIVRHAIDRELHGESTPQAAFNTQSSPFEEFIRLARLPRDLSGEPIRWTRSELYSEREDRWIHQVADEDEIASRPD